MHGVQHYYQITIFLCTCCFTVRLQELKLFCWYNIIPKPLFLHVHVFYIMQLQVEALNIIDRPVHVYRHTSGWLTKYA